MGALLMLAGVLLAGCSSGPLPDESDQPELGDGSMTDRPPPGAPDTSQPYEPDVNETIPNDTLAPTG